MEEFSDRKRCREDNPEEAASPSTGPNTNKKRRKKKIKGDPQTPKEKGAEANKGSEVIPNHEPLGTAISLVPENIQGGNQVQPLACPKHDPPISFSVEKNEITVENTQFCSKLELAVESGKEKGIGVGHNEGTAQNPEKDTFLEKEKNNVFKPQGVEPNHAEHPQLCSPVLPEQKKKKENVAEPNKADAEHPQVLDLAIPAGKVNNEGAERPQVSAGNPPVCPKPESALPVNLEKKKEAELSEPHAEHPQPQPCSKQDPAPLGDQTTPIQLRRKHRMSQGQRKRIQRKGIMCSQGKVENQMNPLQCSLNQIQPHPGIPVDQENIEGAEPPQVNAGNPPVCPKPESALPVNLEQMKEAKPSEPRAEHPQPQPCPKPDPAPPGDQTTPIQLRRRHRMSQGQRKRIQRKGIMCSQGKVENKMNPLQCSLNQIQPHPAITICPKPASPIDQAIPIDQTIPVDPAISICPKPVETIIDQTNPVSPAIPIDTEQKTMKKESKSTLDGAESNEYNTEPSKTPIQTAICPIAVPSIGPAIPTDPEQKMTKKTIKRRKSALESEGKEPNKHNGKPHETPLQRSMCPIAATPIDPAIPMDLIIPIDPEQKMPKKKKSALKSEGEEPKKHNGKPHETPVQRSMCSIAATPVDPTIPMDQIIPIDPATPIDPEQKMPQKKKSALKSEGEEPNKQNGKPHETPLQRSMCPIAATPIDPTIPTDQIIPIDPATPIDPEQKMPKKKKSALKSEGEEPKKHNGMPHETPVQRSMCSIAATPIDPTIPMDQIIPIDPATPIDPEQKMPQKKKSALKSKGEEPNEQNGKPHETPLQRSMCPIAATPIDPTIPTDQIIPIDPATPIDPEQKMPKKKKSALKSKGEEPKKHNGKPNETPVQRSMSSIAATPIDPTIPMDQIIPIDPPIPIDQDQKLTKNERKKERNSPLKSEGTDPDEHNAEPTAETLLPRIKVLTVSKVPFKWPSETSMSEGKAKPPAKTWLQRTEGLKVIKVPFKHSMSEGKAKPPAKTRVQRTEGLKVTKVPFKQHGESSMSEGKAMPPAKTRVQRTEGLKVTKVPFKQHGESSMSEGKAKPLAKTRVQRTEGLKVTKVPFKQHGESSMSESKAKPLAKTRIQRIEGLKVTKVPFKRHGESSMICLACRQPGHKIEGCPRLKCISMDEEVCFFCGEIGHSLGKCSVSKGGRRFAKCLFCYAQGHFSNNCPRNGHGIDPKAVAGIEPIIKTVETEEKSVAEVTTM